MVERPGTAAGYLSCALVAAGRSATRYAAFFARWPVNQKRSALKSRVSSVPKGPATRSAYLGIGNPSSLTFDSRNSVIVGSCGLGRGLAVKLCANTRMTISNNRIRFGAR
jgi:hypothetical protein